MTNGQLPLHRAAFDASGTFVNLIPYGHTDIVSMRRPREISYDSR